MLLSHAMKLGATISKQCFLELFGIEGSSCALGSALLAMGSRIEDISAAYIEIERRWTWLLAQKYKLCPDCKLQFTSAWQIIVHLNDEHRWNRERIADWVATIEPQETPSEQPVEQAEVHA